MRHCARYCIGAHAEQLHEALVQGRARQADAVAELVDRPVLRRLLVDEGERLADEAVAQAGEPARALLGQGVGVAPHRVDEHHLAHAREHRLAARPLRARFEDRLLRELPDPRVLAAGAKVQHPRQRLDQRIERLQVAADEAADDRRRRRRLPAAVRASRRGRRR
jgi:hypothetical protein